ncbi:hypothetical protein PS710_06447 [Pseudomonas fluorescens]|uniref:Lipoprotein n=1 Tax=Pseudomonas fluorescens TaxID=294 RepID=A0A5E7FZ06_PSEFL|nr:hypothetical protein PS710_06447 [Pseudomonas fluorescens]
MSTTLPSAMTVALLTATCMTALADPPKKHNQISTVGEPTAFQASPTSDPAAEDNDAAEGAPGHIQAVGRTGSHSMHPNAPLAAEQFAGDEVEVLRQTGDE